MFEQNSIYRFYIKLKNTYGLDARALSLMRIGVALVLLVDLYTRASSLTEHYTKNGAVPFSLELSYWKPGYFSLFQFCDSHWFAVLIFTVTAFIYIFLLAGYKTTLFTFLSWFLLISLQNRNTLVLQGGDDLLRLLLFFGMLLPWGNFYSIDSQKKRLSNTKRNKFSVATFGYIALLFSMYFFTGILKTGDEWNSKGTAIYYALSLDQMVLPIGKMLLPHFGLLKGLTFFVRWVELLAPFLLFIPFKRKLFRVLFIICVAALQIGFALTLYVGLFYLIALIALIGLLPEGVMDWFDKKFNRFLSHNKKSNNISFFQRINDNYYFNTVKNSFLFFCIALCFIWNIGSIDGSGFGVSDRFSTFGYALRLNQSWGMFAPTVFKDDGWYIMEGTTTANEKIDVNRNGARADYTKPANVLTYIKDDRWRKYQENLLFSYNDFIRPFYCEFLIRDWNRRHPNKKISSLELIYMKEVSVLPNEKQTVTKEVLCACAK